MYLLLPLPLPLTTTVNPTTITSQPSETVPDTTDPNAADILPREAAIPTTEEPVTVIPISRQGSVPSDQEPTTDPIPTTNTSDPQSTRTVTEPNPSDSTNSTDPSESPNPASTPTRIGNIAPQATPTTYPVPPINNLVKKLSAGRLRKALSNLEPRRVLVTMPVFNLRSSFSDQLTTVSHILNLSVVCKKI